MPIQTCARIAHTTLHILTLAQNLQGQDHQEGVALVSMFTEYLSATWQPINGKPVEAQVFGRLSCKIC